ncbi:MAG TPA: ABC transporter substrate-binding protein [Solirubrobacterales bacterium]|nr:ABC transporter substrate-binding protein [Solirubrobacterales bacterium]
MFVTVEGLESASDLGILMAEKRGFFADAGISATVLAPAAPIRSIAYVASGSSAFGVTRLPQAAMSRAEGVKVVAVGSLISQPTMSLIWLPGSGIRSVADLKGKRIAIAGLPFEEGFLESVLRKEGLALDDVRLRRVGYELVPSLLDGRADAILGSWNQEGVELEARGESPEVTRLRSLGGPDYEELVVVGRADRVAEDPRLVRDFMSAVVRGVDAAVDDPAAAVEVLQEDLEANPETDPQARKAEVGETLPLLSTTGIVDADSTEELLEWMHQEGLVKGKLTSSEVLAGGLGA